MQTEYRVVMTATFDTVAKRDAFYTVVRNALLNWLNNILWSASPQPGWFLFLFITHRRS